jgi:hypothetical protein
MSPRQRRVRPPRIHVGSPRQTDAGATLRCVVLALTEDEWIGADLESGALVRAAIATAPEALERFSVVTATLDEAPEPLDPGRPEAITLREVIASGTGTLKRRALRRLLRRLCAPDGSLGVVLSRPGPSLAYVDLAPDAASVAVVGVDRAGLELGTRGDGAAVVTLYWSGRPQSLPIIDAAASQVAHAVAPRGLRAKELDSALGNRIGFALVGLGPVRGGHAPKVCFGLLPR